jgi:hypothetical protein
VAYGGEYLDSILEKLDAEASTADAGRAVQQAVVLRRLKDVMGARLSASPGGIVFDASVDSDEVLLRFFRELDSSGNGTVSIEELLGAPALRREENADMAQTLRRAVGVWCDLAGLEKALEPLEVKDLEAAAAAIPGGQAQGKSAAVRAIFDAVVPVLQAASPLDRAGAGKDIRVATKVDLKRFLESEAQGRPAPGSALAVALSQLADTLLADTELDFLAVKEAARQVPRVAAHRMEWVRGLDLEASLARHLPTGTFFDG